MQRGLGQHGAGWIKRWSEADRSAFEAYGVKDYVVVQKGDVKVAVVGVFGKDALECAPTCELKFKDPVEAVKQTVEEIEKNEKVDMIACVSHGGPGG